LDTSNCSSIGALQTVSTKSSALLLLQGVAVLDKKLDTDLQLFTRKHWPRWRSILGEGAA
jgi:hypothetical protein